MDRETSETMIDQSFFNEYETFKQDFDKLMEDRFQGTKAEHIVLDFMQKHQAVLDNIAFAYSQSKYPDCSEREVLDEDMRIVNLDKNDNDDDNNGNIKDNQLNTTKLTHNATEVYRRAAQACYYRMSYNKSRLKQDDDRSEGLRWARLALRYDPNDFSVSFWYMICLGWYLDTLGNAKLRLVMSQVFKQSALHCIRLDPNNHLAYNLLGRYHYTIANLSWIERTLAKGLLGYKLEANFEDAERELLIGYELRKNWLPNGLWLARVLLARRRPIDEVMQWIEYGLSQDVDEPCGELEREELLELKSKLKR